MPGDFMRKGPWHLFAGCDSSSLTSGERETEPKQIGEGTQDSTQRQGHSRDISKSPYYNIGENNRASLTPKSNTMPRVTPSSAGTSLHLEKSDSSI